MRLFPISQSDSRLFQFNGGKPTSIFSEYMITIFIYHYIQLYIIILASNAKDTKCLWRWEPDRRSNFFFSPPAHLCAVTYVTEISLIVTLNSQFNSTQLNEIYINKYYNDFKIYRSDRIVWVWEGILFIVSFCERYREEYRETVIICYCWSKLSKIHILAMLIWQRHCRLPRLCYVYTRDMNYYIHVPRYVNRVARNKSHRVTVRVFGLKLFCN